MTTQQHILACVDGSAVTESVCDYAAWYAGRLNIPVAVLNVIDVPDTARRDLSKAIGAHSRRDLLFALTQMDEQRAEIAESYSKALIHDAKSYINSHSDVEVKTHQSRGKLLPAIELLKTQNRALVMGRRGEDHKGSQINIGSQIETVARASSTPILICSESFKTPQSYMVAFDASKTAIKATQKIARSEVLRGMQGHIVMVGHNNSNSKNILAAAAAQLDAAGFKVAAHHLPEMDVVDGLLGFQADNNVDLIVIGAYGHAKWQRLFLGSTTTKLIANTVSPIILVH
ncbi:universal stress protein [uncultured Psychrobacter sp.]|uniref:universal stress protein n=1 Tax=uncultured Psychrobacter sp. TaxID=259303 RepID=UPI0034576D5A